MFSKKTIKKNEEKEAHEKAKAILRKVEVFATRYFDALIAIFVMIVFVAGFFFVINPKYKTITETEVYSQEDLEAEKSKLSEYLSKLTEYKTAYQKLSKVSRERVEKVVPRDDYLENFFARVENITKKQGVLITSLSINNPEKDAQNKKNQQIDGDVVSEKKFGEVEILLKVSGIDYSGVKRLLSVFENNLRLMDVEVVKFNTEANKAEFSITSYFLK